MNCHIQNREKMVDNYLRGILAEKEKIELEEHFFNCDACFKELIFQEETVSLVKAEGKVLLSKYLAKADRKSMHKKSLDFEWLYPKNIPWRNVYAYVSLVIVAAFIGVFLFLNGGSDNSMVINYDESVPYEYDMLNLRGGAFNSGQNSNISSFINGFQIGMSDYIVLEYESAIGVFEKIEPLVHQLEADPSNSGYMKWIRNYYYYRGLSHLALSVSKSYGLTEEEKIYNSNEAIELLHLASSMIDKYQLDENDRELFFLGQAYGLHGDKRKAIEILGQIDSECKFFNRSQQLIEEWTTQ